MKEVSVFIAETEDDCLFKSQFDFWKEVEWNNDLPQYFERLNNIDDDRSFVILATTVLEYQIDRFLKIIIPKHEVLVDNNTALNTKIRIIKAFNLIPSQFLEMINLIKNIRNDFAHNLAFDNFKDVPKSENKLLRNIEQMKEYWNKYSHEMVYWEKDEKIRMLFKDIWRVCIEGLRVYEINIELFRQETERLEFIQNLHKLSTTLKIEREKSRRLPFY
ncbi:hypothetical protein MG290_04565 [Flavobacterium sp. CBA20B-1]|uniref:hypothetical protein n=1 Tax=unclassified Flavobacterium TaxID=196869 RepID=UPI0022251100|nr:MULTISPECIES: hypothetical protein [unclassified Flavobacterium]WCM42957.1 hypothetical protein MG290_04565 [Flavobacterium sp. CBA20B-1]